MGNLMQYCKYHNLCLRPLQHKQHANKFINNVQVMQNLPDLSDCSTLFFRRPYSDRLCSHHCFICETDLPPSSAKPSQQASLKSVSRQFTSPGTGTYTWKYNVGYISTHFLWLLILMAQKYCHSQAFIAITSYLCANVLLSVTET